MASITIKLPDTLKDKLEATARTQGKSSSAVVRTLLEKSLAPSQKPSMLDLLRDLAGKGDSGKTDVATNPKYMKGFGQWRE